jgi:hypothetical protein
LTNDSHFAFDNRSQLDTDTASTTTTEEASDGSDTNSTTAADSSAPNSAANHSDVNQQQQQQQEQLHKWPLRPGVHVHVNDMHTLSNNGKSADDSVVVEIVPALITASPVALPLSPTPFLPAPPPPPPPRRKPYTEATSNQTVIAAADFASPDVRIDTSLILLPDPASSQPKENQFFSLPLPQPLPPPPPSRRKQRTSETYYVNQAVNEATSPASVDGSTTYETILPAECVPLEFTEPLDIACG